MTAFMELSEVFSFQAISLFTSPSRIPRRTSLWRAVAIRCFQFSKPRGLTKLRGNTIVPKRQNYGERDIFSGQDMLYFRPKYGLNDTTTSRGWAAGVMALDRGTRSMALTPTNLVYAPNIPGTSSSVWHYMPTPNPRAISSVSAGSFWIDSVRGFSSG